MAFISYWIPLTNTIDFKKSFDELDLNFKTRDISDGVESNPNILKIEIQENKNLHISLNKDEIYVLEYLTSFDNGLLYYKHDIQDDHILRIIHIQVYHLLKDFFHIHECHKDDVDALLIAFCSDDYTCTHIVLKHYAELYKNKFEDYYNIIMEESSPEIISENYHSTNQKIPEAITDIIKQQGFILNIQKEMSYFDFLLSNFKSITEKTYYRREYKNNVIRFNDLYKKYEMQDNLMDTLYSKAMNNVQNYLAILGTILALLGLGLGIWGICLALNGLTTDHFDENFEKVKTFNNDAKILIDKYNSVNEKINNTNINYKKLYCKHKQLSSKLDSNYSELKIKYDRIEQREQIILNQGIKKCNK